jgi:hypothetical protein
MNTLYITGCVPDGKDPNHALDMILGSGWAFTLERAVEFQQKGVFQFRAFAPGTGPSVPVTICKSVTGLHFLRTRADAVTHNNLGKLVVVTPDLRPLAYAALGAQYRNALARKPTLLG